MTINLEYDSSSNQYMVFIKETTPSDKYLVTIGKIGQGDVYPYDGSIYQNTGSIIEIHAIADTTNDFRFVEWDINGRIDKDALTSFRINKAVEAIATFIKQYELTINTIGEGTTDPSTTDFYDEGDIVPITAIPNDESSYLDYWTVNDVDSGNDNPLLLTMTSTSNVVAFFKSFLDYLMDVIGTQIVQDGGLYYFYDNINNNNLQTTNTQIATFDGVGVTVDTNVDVASLSKLTILFQGVKPEGGRFDIESYIDTDNRFRFFIGANESVGAIFNNNTGLNLLSYNDYSTYMMVYDGTLTDNSNRLKIYEHDINGNITQLSLTFTGTIPSLINSSLSDLVFGRFNGGIGYSMCYLCKLAIWDDAMDSSILNNLDNAYQLSSCKFATHFQEKNGVTILNEAQDGSLTDGIVGGAILSDFWANTSDYAEPALLIKGGSKYMVCTSDGIRAHIASPSDGNLGEEEIINGTFNNNVNNWSGNNSNNTRTWEDGAMRIVNLANFAYTLQYHGEWTVGDKVLVEFEILENNSTAHLGVGLGTTTSQGQKVISAGSTGFFRFFTEVYSDKSFQIRPYATGSMDVLIDNISVKNVDAIPAYGEWEFMFKNRVIISIISDDTTRLSNENSYYVGQGGNGNIFLTRTDNGVNSIVFSTAIGYTDITDTYKIKVKRTETGEFSLYIKGSSFGDEYVLMDDTGGTGSNPIIDNTHTTTKYILVDNDIDSEISHISKDGSKYDVDKFINVTGNYKTQYAIGIDSTTDVKGNELEYDTLSVWSTINKYKFPDDTEISQTQELIDKGIYIDGVPQEVDYETMYSIDTTTVVEINKDNLQINNIKIINSDE